MLYAICFSFLSPTTKRFLKSNSPSAPYASRPDRKDIRSAGMAAYQKEFHKMVSDWEPRVSIIKTLRQEQISAEQKESRTERKSNKGTTVLIFDRIPKPVQIV